MCPARTRNTRSARSNPNRNNRTCAEPASDERTDTCNLRCTPDPVTTAYTTCTTGLGAGAVGLGVVGTGTVGVGVVGTGVVGVGDEDFLSNRAVTACARVMSTEHDPLPEHAPPQPPNDDPFEADAVKLTRRDTLTVHDEAHATLPDASVTVPAPEPEIPTDNGNEFNENTAVTE